MVSSLTYSCVHQVFAQLSILLSLIIELNLVELIDPVLRNFQVFYRLVRRVVAEFIVRRHSFDLRTGVVVVEAFDGNKFCVLKQSSLESDLEVLPVGPESSKRVVYWRRVVVPRPDRRNKYQIVHFRKLFQFFPVLPCREVGGTVGSVESVETIKVRLPHDCFAFLCSEKTDSLLLLLIYSETMAF